MNLCGGVSFWLQVPQHQEWSPCSSGLEPTSYRPEKSDEQRWEGEQGTSVEPAPEWHIADNRGSGILLTIGAVAALGTFATCSPDTVYNHSGYCLLLLVKGEGEVCDKPKPLSVLCILSPWLCYS